MSAKEMILGQAWNLPRQVSEVQGKDPGTFLAFNTHMVTFYQQTYGELSRFFLALREGRLIGSKCPKCKQVNVPAATWHCPTCDFVEMKEVELPHRGVLAATAPITIFPSASFIGDAPFARGYVDVATNAPIASFLPSRLRTTTGLPRPGIFVKGVELKLVFEDQRMGSIRDIFWVPMSEVPARLRDRKPLLASQLDFARPRAPGVERSKASQGALGEALSAMRQLAGKVKKSPRAQKDLAGRKHSIGVKTGGGNFTIQVAAGSFRIGDGLPRKADFVMVAQDPAVFSRWVADGSLTDAAVEGKLWLPHKEAFGVLPILDRLPRSVRRDLR
ncbi:MAG TPA: zinc ribbon domain-containing protein [Anaeromyxobacteraceae bacterium]|nr:zinc ribbon domain-containing protein [Anaeromyxobacteraceae bacterium]